MQQPDHFSLNGLKLPPQSAEAEQALLGAIFERNSLVDELEDILREQYFYRHEHQVIYRRMSAMALQGQPIDPAILIDYLDAAGELESAGGAEYLVDIFSSNRGSHNARHYAKIVKDRWLQRQLISKGQKIVEIGFESENRYAGCTGLPSRDHGLLSRTPRAKSGRSIRFCGKW